MRIAFPVCLWWTLLLAAVLILPGCGSGGSRPDIILVTLDTTRADRLGCYGYPLADTPHLDAFASRAVLFENATATIPVTSPSHASMLTALTPLRHGVRNNGSFILNEDQTTVTELLAAEGYQTAAFLSAFVLNRTFGLSQGFETYDDDVIEQRTAAETTAKAVAWLNQAGSDPMFLWVHYFDPHTPWDPAEPYASQTRGTPYDAEISEMDASFGDLMAALRSAGRFDDAHIFVVGDHGEGLEDHQELGHGVFLYEDCLQVPYIWKAAGQEAGRRESGLVGTVDLLPTMIELGGGDAPASEDIDGASLVGIPDGGPVPERTGLYLETLYPYYNYGWSPLYAWRTETLKLIEAPRPELYDLAQDPDERVNLIEEAESESSAAAAELEKHLRNYRLRHESTSALPEENELTPEVEERLRSLGYVWTAGHEESPPADSLPDPKDVIGFFNSHYELAKTLAEAGRWEEAATELQIVVEQMPDNATALLALGHSLVKVGRGGEGIPWLERFLEMRPTNTFGHETMGDALVQLERYDDAHAAYERAAEHESALRSTAKKRGMIFVRQQRFDEARASFERGKAASVGEEKALWDEWIEAAAAIERFGTDRPAARGRDWAAQVRGAAALELEDRAKDLLARGRDRGFDERTYWGLAAELAEQRLDWEATRAALRQLTDRDSLSQRLYLMLMVANLNLGDLTGARDAGREGADRASDPKGRLHYNLACIHARLGQVEEGVAALTEAVALGYDNLNQLEGDPELESLRGEPGYAAALDEARQRAGATNRP